MIEMPGRTYSGPLPPLTAAQASIRDELVRDVGKLASDIGERNIWLYQNLAAAVDFIEVSLADGGYRVNRQNFRAEGKICSNIETEISGTLRSLLHFAGIVSFPPRGSGPGIGYRCCLVRPLVFLAARLPCKIGDYHLKSAVNIFAGYEQQNTIHNVTFLGQALRDCILAYDNSGQRKMAQILLGKLMK